MNQQHNNVFVSGALVPVFFKTAAPIILIMLVNGSFTLLDAYFLGKYVGAEALAAVTLTFPMFMLLIALSSLISSGYSSVQARLLGAGKKDQAKQAFSQAITLALAVSAVLMLLFIAGGKPLTVLVANGSKDLADMGYTYLTILVFLSPALFIGSVNSDTLRCEGQLSLMAIVSLFSVLLNIIFNYIFIAHLELGVAGSAYGTALAQTIALLIVAVYRYYGRTVIDTQIFRLSRKHYFWPEYLSLGLPSSLSYIGVSLTSIAVIFSIQIWGGGNYDTTVSAYGITTRIMTFIFLPLLGLSQAFQTLVGNNAGAKSWSRTDSSINIALTLAFGYCLALQIGVIILKDSLGTLFVSDRQIITEVARILPMMTLVYFLAGPLMMVSTFFQAIGDAKRAAILGLAKTYIFVLPLILTLPLLLGEVGIWYAGPMAELMLLTLTAVVLYQRGRNHGYKYGLYSSQQASI
ncbi:MATE family efflux transporter [Microbulbifer sp. OS29]|uniref:Multidrug export protein MepA n=1 Tax=Microbulbifer okhotskensis TaxID=2926617 RepID=A0A9X2J4R0_9GAMM|nr:MATE family efflux transporter [Microbulbifer okhotskensis]MCO1334378.1 MATE family efflux transporter [Microbulbifer okhotskensis]